MRKISITELKADFSKLVSAAAAGEPFIITVRGKPVAKAAAVDVDEFARDADLR